MRELSSYINEKLDINKVNLISTFPINEENIAEMANFLKEAGFDDINVDGSNIVKKFNSERKKCFYLNIQENLIELVFCDTENEKISDSNPIYAIRKLNINDLIRYIIYNGVNNPKCIEKEEFLKIINKKFHWK